MDTNAALPEEHRHRKTSYLLLAIGCILLAIAFLIGITDNPPGIVAMLAGFFAVVLGIVYRSGKSGKRNPGQQLLYWAPRVLCVVIAVFISMFALDVFGEGKGFWGTTLALLMHLIPTFILVAVLVVSWRREWIGGILFIVLGALYVVWALEQDIRIRRGAFMIGGPPVLIGALFLLNWRYKAKLRPNP